ncbi:MAG: acyl carrier protein [Chloroflexi bacterium]|nr:acyl carrier protein [Chloroflexota bacterium]
MTLSLHPNEARLRGILAQVLEINESSVDDDTSMETVEEWDSLKQIFLILAIEEQFALSLDEQRAVELVSLPLLRDELREHGIEF